MEVQRNTKQKQLILSILKKTDRPMSINEIYADIVVELPKIAKSTIYRNIDSLLQQNLIDKYHLKDNEIFYRIKADRNEHKHLVICDDCKKVFDLPSCPIHALENAMEEEGFIIRNHQIQINGLCKTCARKHQIK
ncbi:transcriptional repressor [Lachnospiraceae bacterium MD1]|jgi:Fe2+ or Zn2+ uptake regulation protein|uniref:Transcriptional repressor n=1 Tax=Variimorphobacter saccharofermentans TaxID=2755051 RepID=A0A839JY29_9FIRM|nr:transcriptional repressor [Variimorphobacter saccharofermentans]MBB2182306.1 transcriptional repressor [Variimorphobacter saccharofermentans]